MDHPQPEASIASARTLQAKGLGFEGGRSRATREPAVVVDVGRASPGKPVGAVVAATNVLRALHGSERPLNASEVARAPRVEQVSETRLPDGSKAEGAHDAAPQRFTNEASTPR